MTVVFTVIIYLAMTPYYLPVHALERMEKHPNQPHLLNIYQISIRVSHSFMEF